MTNTPRPPQRYSVALAACSFELQPNIGDDGLIQMQLTPAGVFHPVDGRALKVPGWKIDAAIASRVISRFAARKNPVVVDYEHQTIHKETNGQPAPAAAWMRALQWREGSGLWATAEATAQAVEQIRTGAYRYISPVFRFHEKTGEVLAIEMAALTNTPAIDGMQALEVRAAASFAYHPDPEDSPMNPLLKALLTALGLPDSTTEDDAIAACSSLSGQLATLKSLTAELGVEGAGAVAACSALKTRAATVTADPAKFVPVGVVEELRGQIAALSAERNADKVSALVDAGLADGRLLPAQKDWAVTLGESNVAALSQYLDTATPIAALSKTQTGGRQPEVKDENGLTEGELAICSMTGVSPKAYAAAKPKS